MNVRTLNFINQLKKSFIYKIIGVIISFFLIRLMIQYLGIEMYGIWVVILTFINWIIFFDFGITNGIKNKLTEALSNNDYELSKEYISTGYVILFILFFILFFIFLIVSYFINWQLIFNTTILDNTLLKNTLVIILFFILLNFVLSIIGTIALSAQNASLLVMQQMLSQLLALFTISSLIIFFERSLTYLAFCYGFSLVFSNIIISYIFYKNNKILIPAFSKFRISIIKPIVSMGMKFFYLQLTIFFILTTDSIIISHLIDNTAVSYYDILFKYFGILMIIHSIVNTPLWTMYTEAYLKKDKEWLIYTLKKMSILTFFYGLVGLIMILFASKLIPLWINENNLDLKLSNYIFMLLLTITLIWYSIFAYFTNGINKTKNQLISSFIGAVVHIPLAIYFVKELSMGLNGVMLSTIISLSIFGITGPIQAYLELRKLSNEHIL